MLNLVPSWNSHNIIHSDTNGFTVIYGEYNHKNSEEKSRKEMGVCWTDFPKCHGVLAPCVVAEKVRNAMLIGLLQQAKEENDKDMIIKIEEAIGFFS